MKQALLRLSGQGVVAPAPATNRLRGGSRRCAAALRAKKKLPRQLFESSGVCLSVETAAIGLFHPCAESGHSVVVRQALVHQALDERLVPFSRNETAGRFRAGAAGLSGVGRWHGRFLWVEGLICIETVCKPLAVLQKSIFNTLAPLASPCPLLGVASKSGYATQPRP